MAEAKEATSEPRRAAVHAYCDTPSVHATHRVGTLIAGSRNGGAEEEATLVATHSFQEEIGSMTAVIRTNGRLFEWMTSLMMLGMAFVIALNPQTVKVGGFYLMSYVGLTAPVLGVIFTLVSCVRVAALFANGFIPAWGPRARGACAIVGAAIWAQMMCALAAWSSQNGYISIGVPVYAALTLGELISCYRAATDVRTRSNPRS